MMWPEIVPGTCNSYVDMCHERAECMQRRDGQFVCRCVPGYMGNGLLCEPIGKQGYLLDNISN